MFSGASVAVECKDESSKDISFRKEVKTDNNGEFKVQLPFSVSKHVKKIEGCSVKLISSSEPYCAVASTATSSSLHLKSRKQGLHIFSAGFFTFKPLKQPNLCNQKPSIENSNKGLDSNKASLPPLNGLPLPPPIQDPTIPGLPPFQYLPPLPPLPQLPPLPTLPPLPPLPWLPKFPPVQGKTSTESKPTETSSKKSQLSDEKVVHPQFFFPAPPILPPNPLQPPSIFPPNPFQPPPLIPNPFQPPPLLPNPFQPPPLIPNPFQLPPVPLIPLPPIPGLTPSPTPPSLPIPFPPLIPLPPIIPRIPGIPPASYSSSKQTP